MVSDDRADERLTRNDHAEADDGCLVIGEDPVVDDDFARKRVLSARADAHAVGQREACGVVDSDAVERERARHVGGACRNNVRKPDVSPGFGAVVDDDKLVLKLVSGLYGRAVQVGDGLLVDERGALKTLTMVGSPTTEVAGSSV